jgi:hypothetical protein
MIWIYVDGNSCYHADIQCSIDQDAIEICVQKEVVLLDELRS